MSSTDQEQYLLELINEARLDPVGNAARYLSSYDPLTARQDDIQAAVDGFAVSGPDLLAALSALAPAQPLAWNDSLATASRRHDAAMIAADAQLHLLPGEVDFAARDAEAGYGPMRQGAENIYAYADDPLYAHAGFMIDWGNDEPGHRTNIMNPDLREVGIGIVANTNGDADFGPMVVTEDFGTRGAAGAFVLGVGYADRDRDGFYSVGEGVAGLSASVAGVTATAGGSGGYALQTSATGPQTVTLTGGGLSGTVTVGLDLVGGTNVKLDVVDGATLQTSASAAVSGPIGTVQGLGTRGLSITTGAGTQTLVGTGGADTLRAGLDDDVVRGGPGNDALFGGGGNDNLGGGRGDDALHGGKGDDVLRGGLGNDTLFGGGGRNTLQGGAGDNTFFGGAGSTLFVFGGGATGHNVVNGFNGGNGDRLALQGQAYALGAAPDGSARLTVAAGGTVDLAGLRPDQVGPSFFA